MGLVVDADTAYFASRLAVLRGVTVEQAVGAAVRAELVRAERTPEPIFTAAEQARVDRTMAMVANLPRLSPRNVDLTASLYDESGLPV